MYREKLYKQRGREREKRYRDMGKVNYESHLQHFSHEHPLELTNIFQQHYPSITREITCSGCKEGASPSDQWIYTCKSCNFILHIPCAQMPNYINHPLDPNHPLILLPSPAYPGGFFNCDACGRQNNTGFSYHCTVCDLDLHILCATKPVSINHQSYNDPLNLPVYPPNNHGASVQQPQPQPQPIPQYLPQGVVHQRTPGINNNMAPPSPQEQYDHVNSSPSMGSVHELFMNSQQAYNQQLQQQLQLIQQQQQHANEILAVALQGMFEGTAAHQQLGQNTLQCVMGGGGTSDIFQSILRGGNNGVGGGGSSDILQSVMGGLNNGGAGANEILGGGDIGGGPSDIITVQSILEGGADSTDSYTSILDSIGYRVNILDLI